MEFGKFISQALKITWQHKVLWLFAALPMVVYLIPGLFLQTPVMTSSFQPMNQREAVQFMSQFMSQFLGFFAIQCFAGLIAFVITPISLAGMIKGIQNALSKKKLAFQKLFQESLRYYWRLFLIPFIAILISIIVSVIMVLIIALFSSLSTDQSGTFSIFLLICCFYIVVIAGAILLGIVFLFSYIGIVMDDLNVGQALSRSWGFIRTQFGHVFAATIIYGFIGFVVFAIMYAVYFGVTFAAMGSWDFRSLESMAQFYQGWVPKVFLLVFYALFSIVTVFFYALWTQTYQALRDMPVTKRITQSKTRKS